MKIMMLIKHLKKQVNKTIREIRKENWYKDKVLRDWILHLIQKKIIMSLKKLLVLLIVTILDMKVLEIKTKIC